MFDKVAKLEWNIPNLSVLSGLATGTMQAYLVRFCRLVYYLLEKQGTWIGFRRGLVLQEMFKENKVTDKNNLSKGSERIALKIRLPSTQRGHKG